MIRLFSISVLHLESSSEDRSSHYLENVIGLNYIERMNFFYTIIYLCLLVFNSQSQQVSALLNITEEALIVSRKLLKEVEGNLLISSEDALHKKLNSITEIAFDFEKNYQHESKNLMLTYDWLRYVENDKQNEIQKNLPLSFMKILSKFNQLYGEITYVKMIVPKKYSYSLHELVEDNEIYLPSEIYKKEFLIFAKNKYNLNVKETQGFSFDIYQYRQDIFRDLHQLFFYTEEESHLSIFEFLKNTAKYVPQTTIWSSSNINLPPQLRLYNIVRNLMVTEAFFCVFHQYNIALLKVYSDAPAYLKNNDRRALELMKQYWGELDAVHVMKNYEQNFQERSIEMFSRVKPALYPLPRRFSLPAPYQENEYSPSIKLNLFDKYIINEVDLNADGSCKKTCSDYKQVERVFGCFDKGICSVHKQCKGKLWDCEDIAEPMHVCPGDEISEHGRRYKFIKGSNYDPERSDYCATNVTKVESWHRGFYKCSYCQCKCEETGIQGSRYFSLRPATSNIYENYIIIHAGFVTINNVVHLEVAQGKLLPNGQQKAKSYEDTLVPTQEFNVTDYNIVAGKDFQAVTRDVRTICLDELDSPKDHVLTGLRLNFQDGYFKLEIRLTQFDYVTGKLYPEKTIWYSKDTNLNQRPKINLDDFRREPRVSIKSEGCFQFTEIQTEDNAGIQTVPYITHPNDLWSEKYAPLSGAGLILKKRENVYLDLQFITQDVVAYI